jgi:hypothetical protein
MWLLLGVLILLCLLPMAFASLVWLVVLAWRICDALLQGGIGGVVLFYRLTRWTVRVLCAVARHLRAWHATGTTWAGQWLRSFWSTYSYVLTRRYLAGQLRIRRRSRHK